MLHGRKQKLNGPNEQRELAEKTPNRNERTHDERKC